LCTTPCLPRQGRQKYDRRLLRVTYQGQHRRGQRTFRPCYPRAHALAHTRSVIILKRNLRIGKNRTKIKPQAYTDSCSCICVFMRAIGLRHRTDIFTPPPIGERSIVMSVSVCVCLSVRDHIFGNTHPIFIIFSTLPMAEARAFSGGVMIRCIYFRFCG